MKYKPNRRAIAYAFMIILFFVGGLAVATIAIIVMVLSSKPNSDEIVKPEIEVVHEVRVEVIKEKPVQAEREIVTLYLERDADHETNLSTDDKILLAGLVHAEAGNQDEIGKRLVADVVLNRVDSDRFPDTLAGVIMQEGQFVEPADNYTDADMLAVEKELEARLDGDVLYFRTKEYHKHGTPLYQHGAHYFSGR